MTWPMQTQRGDGIINPNHSQPRRKRGGWSDTSFTPGKRPGTRCREGWLGPTAGLYQHGKFCPTRTRFPDRQAVPTELSRLPFVCRNRLL